MSIFRSDKHSKIEEEETLIKLILVQYKTSPIQQLDRAQQDAWLAELRSTEIPLPEK